MKQMIEMIKQIVENIELIFCQCSPQPHGERHFIKSRSVVLTMPRLSLKVLENLRYRYGYSSPRYSVRTTTLSLYLILKVSQVFKLQDKHNASFFSNMSWRELAQSVYKVSEFY